MINSLLEEIRKLYRTEFGFVSELAVKERFISLLVLKYYCDTEKYTYEELINKCEIEDVFFPVNDMEVKVSYTENLHLLAFIQYANLKDLVKEYLSTRNFEIDFINNDENKICIPTKIVKELYDLSGKTTYVIDKFDLDKSDIALFKFFDKVLGVNNTYVKYEEANIDSYDYIYIYDDIPKYRFMRNKDSNIYWFIGKLVDNKSKVILHTDYKKVSNMSELRFLINDLVKVILYDDKNTFLYFGKNDNKQVSIIDYNRDKIKSIEQLYKVINNDRKQKDILIKITADDIKNNYCRLGFKLYQNKLVQDIRNINEIVDENTRLIETLARINVCIEQEINKLINR